MNDYCYQTNVAWVAYANLGGNSFNVASGTATIGAGGVYTIVVSGVAQTFYGGGFIVYNGIGGPATASSTYWFAVGNCTQPSGGWSFTNSLGFVPVSGPVLKPVFARRRLPGGG